MRQKNIFLIEKSYKNNFKAQIRSTKIKQQEYRNKPKKWTSFYCRKMKFSLNFALWTMALGLVLLQQGTQGSPSTESPSTLIPLTLIPPTGSPLPESSALGKERIKRPNPFDVLNMDEVRSQIRSRNWAYRPAKPYSITKSHVSRF